MKTLWGKAWMAAVFVLAGASLGMAQPTRMPMPGSLNATQGRVTMDGFPAPEQFTRGQRLHTGQFIETQHGKAELLLTPGSFLRIGDHSQVRMVSSSLENAAVRLDRGHALLDAGANYNRNLTVFMDGARVRIDRQGLYGFNAVRRRVSVLRGKARVFDSDSRVTLKGKRELKITGHLPLRVRKLNVRAFKSSSLYRWNTARSRYEANARRSVQQAIARTGHWYGPGWYWSHYWGFYAYLPSAGAYSYWGPYAGSYYYEPWGWNAWGPGWGWEGGGDDDD